ncbi:HTH_Tnp_Tc3_2 domain-containing protein [Trichonephila clavipes]|nr:HTH_Tnp_Tc3_2 domain-containing protein [Trichonephila clavipes]
MALSASLPQINLGVQGETQVGHHTLIEKTIVGRDPKCPSARRLRMVREDTGTPTEGSTCAWMAADEADGSQDQVRSTEIGDPRNTRTPILNFHSFPITSAALDASIWSGTTHEETGLQWNETRLSLATNPDSISAVTTIVFVCGDPVVNASILPLLYSDTPLPQLM